MVAAPEEYPWSSCRYRLGQTAGGCLDDDPCYVGLGNGVEERQAGYRQLLDAAVPVDEWALIRDAVQRGQLTGKQRFVDAVEEILGRRIEHRSPGRPSKAGARRTEGVE